MSNFIHKTYYDNTIAEWATAFGIMLGALVLGKFLYWICSAVIKRLTARTRTNIDDLIVDMVEEPFIVALTIAGILVGLSTLSLSLGARATIAGLRQFVIIMCITWLIARIIEAVFTQLIAPMASKTENDLDDQLLPLVRKGSKVAVWSLGTIVALNNAGYNVGALIAGLGIGGLALAMAAKDTVSNVFGGFTVFTDRPFVMNDRVRVAGFDGVIKEVGIRSTRLQTLDGPIVTIPNSTFSDSPVVNVTLEPSRKITMDIGLTYDTSPEAMQGAMDLLRELTGAMDEIEDNVVIAFDAFGDSAMIIKLVYCIKKGSDIMAVKTRLNMDILRRFSAEKLEFAYPTQTIYSKSA